MKVRLFVLIAFLLCGHLESRKVPVKKIARIVKESVQPKLPALPKLTTVAKQAAKVKDLLRYHDRASEVVWKRMENSVLFLRKVAEFLKKRNITITAPPPGWRWNEFLICKPSKPGKSCLSACERKGTGYAWCWTDAGQESWDHCQCVLRDSVRHWIQLAKQRLMSSAEEPMIGCTSNDLLVQIQWIVIGVLVAMATIAATGLQIKVMCDRRKTREIQRRLLERRQEEVLDDHVGPGQEPVVMAQRLPMVPPPSGAPAGDPN